MQSPVLVDVTLTSTRPLLMRFSDNENVEFLARGGKERSVWLPPTLPKEGQELEAHVRDKLEKLHARVLMLADREGGIVLPDKKSERDPVLRALAEPLVQKDDSGRFIIPRVVVFSSLRDAGCHMELPERKISYKGTGDTMLPAVLRLIGGPFVLRTEGWTPDYRFVANYARRNNTRIADYRMMVNPRFERWSIRVQAVVTPNLGFTLGHARALFEIAGSKVGFGAMRGERHGHQAFGTFRIEKWDTAAFDGPTNYDRPTFENVARAVPAGF